MINNKGIFWAAGVSLLAATTQATADVNQTGWSLSILGQYTLEDTREVDDGIGARVGLSYPLANWLVLEGLVGYQEFEGDDPATAPWQDEYTLGLDYQFHVLPTLGAVHPYLIAGVGAARTVDLTSPYTVTNDGYAALGLGFDIGVTDRMAITLDARNRWLLWDEARGTADPTELMFGLGVSFDLSPEPQIVVINSGDGAGNDGDHDGVPDSLDRCPNTPRPAVDAYGCLVTAGAADSDGDGVPDSQDRCPNTPAGTPVDAEGCPAPETVIIYFAFDSAELNGPAKNALNVVAANLKERDFVVAIANGHADRTGTEAYNLDLSKRRANSVADYLRAQGVGANQIRTRAFGESRPLNAGETPAQRARNRRVEINLIEE